MSYIEVVVAVNAQEVDRIFEYAIPPELVDSDIGIGSRVVVPFGRANKCVEGFVVGINETPAYKGRGMKSVHSMPDGGRVFNEELLELARWMRTKYMATLYDCLRAIIPAGVKLQAETVLRLIDVDENMRLSESQAVIVDYIRENGGSCLLSELENEIERPKQALKTLVSKGIISEISNIQEANNLPLFVNYTYLNHDNEELEEFIESLVIATQKNSAAKAVIEFLLEQDGTPVSDLRKFLKISASPIKTLAAKNMITIEKVQVLRSTTNSASVEENAPKHELTADQHHAVSEILTKGRAKPTLIHGVTGSGKTEIYMRLIEQVLSEGKQAIMLVPEISLTPQTVNTFLRRFGDKLSVTHSRLSLGERYDQWKKARDGVISIMIGPRSAVFAPFGNLGLIIIDEEHEKTYKSETTPKYSTYEVAAKRAELSGGFVVMGSATPLVETYHDALEGRINLITISSRVNDSPPAVHIVDMREELAEGNMSIFSRELEDALRKNFVAGRQSILFLNRRGFSTFVSCRKCGFVMQCENCTINYTYHFYDKRLACHYCGKKVKNPSNCPQCGSKYIKYFGLGTQKVEEEVKKLLPDAVVARMDMDTTTGKNKHEEILARFRSGEAKVLIGTQMIAKGLDFPNVTVVGVIAADLSLNNGDFRSAETTFQLLTQVAGRAGRAVHKGDVYIQTYQPEHYSIICSQTGDYRAFFEQEISIRKQMAYPPYSHIFTILMTGESEKKIIKLMFKLHDLMREQNLVAEEEILGPMPATVAKIKRKYRWRMIVKHHNEASLRELVLNAVAQLRAQDDLSDVSLNITLDPLIIY